MIDCKVSVDKKEDPKGDRVVLTFEYVCCSNDPLCSFSNSDYATNSGKFLKYAQW